MKRYKCVVTRREEYIIELDDSKLNQEWMQEFKEVFYDFDDLEEHAEHIAKERARFGDSFLEGYGIPMVNGKSTCFDKTEVNENINIKIISEDDDCDVDVYELGE